MQEVVMKKLSILLILVLAFAAFAGCGGTAEAPAAPAAEPAAPAEAAAPTEAAPAEEAPATANGDPVELTVVTSYGGDDGNRANYETYMALYEEQSGNVVRDASGTSNEEWKARIMADFETGAEPDVLFFFTVVDANQLVEGVKLVPLDEIRTAYPDYAGNMKEDMLPASPADGKKYAIPVNGYWEGMFVNKAVLTEAGVEIPGATTTWDEFMTMCQTIKDAGFTPIAASLAEVPHYWFEFCVFNNGSLASHATLPAASTDAAGQAWAAGFNDIKALFDAGYFPANTNTATDPETNLLMVDDSAAFMIDGSWKVGWFAENDPDRPDNYTVTYVPAKGERKPTDVVGGISMGYYITRKAWDDPAKQAAAVDFIKTMTTDEAVSAFGATSITALTNGASPPDGASPLELAAIEMTKGATGIVPATADGLNATARGDLFANVPQIVTGAMTPEAAIDQALAITE
jgi:raffinose/stachyose/melibiose transport system substrate-binding protein